MDKKISNMLSRQTSISLPTISDRLFFVIPFWYKRRKNRHFIIFKIYAMLKISL